MTLKRRLWSSEELTIAYYLAKFGRRGIPYSQRELAQDIIGKTTLKSLNCQVATFRYLLGIEGEQLRSTSKLKEQLVIDLSHHKPSVLRDLVTTIIENRINPFTKETLAFLYSSRLKNINLN